MKNKILFFYSLSLLTTLSLGPLACSGGGSGSQDGSNPQSLAALEILNCPSGPLAIGEEIPFQVEGRAQDGQVLLNIAPDFAIDRPRYLAIDSDGKAKALYPGEVRVTAAAGEVQSAECALTISPPANFKTLTQLTQNSDEDHWGMNNNWPMTAEGFILWQSVDLNGDVTVLLHDLEDPRTVNTPIETLVAEDVDFMALGSSGPEGETLASYRVGLVDTKISDHGSAPLNLGDRQQEENSIADGCFFFREGGGANDIQNFILADGLMEIISAGETYGPITSGCKAVWETRGAATSELTFYDGDSLVPVADGLPFFPQYDLRGGRIVFAKDGDVFLVDTTQSPIQSIPLTQDRTSIVDDSPKTDGNSVVWRQIDGVEQRIVMLEIASGRRRTISTTPDPKDGTSLQIDLKQATWLEGASLWFHDGENTEEVALSHPIDTLYNPYLADGLLTWIGNDGDTEVFFLN